jgi:hypothetical protein
MTNIVCLATHEVGLVASFLRLSPASELSPDWWRWRLRRDFAVSAPCEFFA